MTRGKAILSIVLGAASAAMGAGPEQTDQQIFQEFLGWYKTDYKGSFAPPEVTKAYTAKLTASGVTETEAKRRIGVLQRIVSAMPREFASLHFDRIYRMPNPPFKLAASQFLVRMVEGRRAGKALDVAMGQGRNSHFLASQGWEVTGYDISEGGLSQARQLAEKAGLKIRTVCAAHEEFDYGTAQWDLIVETFAFTNLSNDAYRRRLIDSLKPGGMVVIEGFGNPDAKELRSPLLEGFKELRLMAYEARDEVADWGMNSARLERMAAIKP
jgi:2-polyprenyl-3-methyl-5-hydroxy-6-metoxy-1,4-benzoquinol methylase